jgi:hypothetical protein
MHDKDGADMRPSPSVRAGRTGGFSPSGGIGVVNRMGLRGLSELLRSVRVMSERRFRRTPSTVRRYIEDQWDAVGS